MNRMLHQSKLFLKRNGSTILTYGGVIGVVATAILTAKAVSKSTDILEKAEESKGEELTKFEKVKVVGPAYIPAITVGAATITCICGASILNKKQQASLASAYILLDRSYKEYKAKVVDLYGEEVDQKIKNEVAKDHYTDDAPDHPDDNKQLYYDEYSQRYFEATSEDLLRAENRINRILAECSGAYLNEYYEALGIETTDYGNYVGWSSCELYETGWASWLYFYHNKVVMDDGLEVTIIRYGMDPTFDFENYY